MFLKSIDILGFKSFADRTHIEFSDGITALLGPNGCGKSNVVDAIKWALGEQASRAMRAEKMEDVIFNGTETRKALGVAEVTLTLANDAGFLALDRPEVEIKRRLYRSGESEYLINGAETRLKEIRELFWDTGIGKGAYSVMEQGRIDQVLSSKPEERRYLFEEAAGITKIKVKNAEARRNLERVEENIRQEEGILKEIRHSYDTLKVQSEKTLRYRGLNEEVFNAELDIQLLRLRQQRNNRDSSAEGIVKKTADRDRIAGELAGITKSISDNMDVVNAMEAELAESQKKLYELAIERNKFEMNAKHLVEQRGSIRDQLNANEGKARSLENRIEALQDEVDAQNDVVRDMRKKLESVDENIRSFEDNIKLAATQINANGQAIRGKQDDIVRFEAEQAGAERNLEKITDDIVAALDAGLKEAGYSASERKTNEAAFEDRITRLQTLLTGRKTLADDYLRLGKPFGTDEIAKFGVSLDEAVRETAALKTLFEKYRASTPTFIDDFLAPEGIITQKRTIDAKIRASKENAGNANDEIRQLRGKNEELNVKIGEYRQTLEDLRVNRAQMEANAKAAEEQSRLIQRQLAEQENALKTLRNEIYLGQKRFEEINEQISDTEAEIAHIEVRGNKLSADMEKIEKDIKWRNRDLEGKQGEIQKKQEALNAANHEIGRLDLVREQAANEIINIQESFRDSHSRDLMEFEERIYQIRAPLAELRENLQAAKNAVRELGQVNLMAPEEFVEVKARYELHTAQMDDMKKSLANLEKITAEMRAESSARFIKTYNTIKRNFHNMFRRLFGGGRAELRLSDTNHVLESGIEILAQPPGKKLENISLLSGGEKSMTAVALLFATYMVKPSPFCLLDEIDAALDEANVSRFVQILREFSGRSQFVVITHNKKTMIGAGSLLGVSMEESGVTKMIAIRMTGEEEARAMAVAAEATAMAENFVEEDIEPEEGRELPPGINDPAQVTEADLHPLR
ncbi:MAG: AAA family ATPase [Spirochaetaceae bacterium]|nr:AAA family ATPase [Spirochaetaceae bacterium]